MPKNSFCISDLQKGQKMLQSVVGSGDAKKDSDTKPSSDSDLIALQHLEQLYDDYDGNLDKIFAELKCNPMKAKKSHHCPGNGKEFSVKYMQGFYSVIDENVSDEKNYK
mmetsp:Transcript_27292/g.26103  ORF Transcript_27292/g.26103 Transcript_27292/m.26103 type:complete len:109 (-) Transcript_27292:1364-1690(-)